MEKQYHTLVQGTDDWHQFRAAHFAASEAPAMLGLSKYQSRDDLLKLKKTGISQEIDPATQQIFNLGHKYEALARPFAEEIIGEELFSPSISIEIEGLRLSASLDGEPMVGPIWEHKTLNQNLARDIPNGIIDPMYAAQMEQQLLISGADKCLFMASKDGDRESVVWCWYESDPELRKRIIAGWHQFQKDLESFEAPEVAVEVVAESVASLPAVSVQVEGSIDVIDNFQVFGGALRLFIDEKLIKSPETDQDFADLEAQIKTLKKAEDALNVAEAAMLAQVEPVSNAKISKDMFFKLARDNRLMAEKLIKSKKEEIKAKIVGDAINVVREHVAGLNEELAVVRLPEMPNNMASVIKGKRSIDKMRSALNDEIANVKIQADDADKIIRANLKTLNDAGDYGFLFNDLQQVVSKAPEDFTLLAESRISHHKEAEEERLEADRERIRQEEQDKLEAEQKAKEQAEENARQDEVRQRVFEEQQRAEAEQDQDVEHATEQEQPSGVSLAPSAAKPKIIEDQINEPDYVYSTDDERFSDYEEAMESLREQGPGEYKIARGIAARKTHASYVNAHSIIEHMQESAYEDAGEFMEGYLDDLDAAALLALSNEIVAVLNSHAKAPNFYGVTDIEKITVTVSDEDAA